MAGRIPQSFLDELVARADIVEIIGARVPLKKSGREFKACCPFHGEKTPSFWVSPDKQFYHCFGCGAHGTAIRFLMEFEKLGFVEAVEVLAQRSGLEMPREAREARDPHHGDLHRTMGDAARFFEQNLNDDARARNYLQGRRITHAAINKFALGYATDSWNALLTRFAASPQDRQRLLQAGLVIERDRDRGGDQRDGGYYDRFRDRLMFPIRDSRGRVIAFGGRIIEQGEPKYMNSPETALFHKGRELYGVYEARQAHTKFTRVLVVEGYMDVIGLHQAGITYAVATLGTATTQEHLNKIFRLSNEVVFCFDGDRAGRAAAWRALENALPLAQDGREFKFLFLPDGHDPDSLVAEEGAATFEARIAQALPLSEYLVKELSAQTDLAHADGRAKLAALAKPLFSRMPDGVLRELLVDRLAGEIRMPAVKLKPLLLIGSARRESTGRSEVSRPERFRASAGRGNLLSQAIGLVLHHPRAARLVNNLEELKGLEKPGIGVLRTLLEQALQSENPTAGSLLERWRDLPEFDRLVQLATEPAIVATVEAAASEIEMAIQKLVEMHGPSHRIDELLRKSAENSLNYDEKTELSALLKTRNQIRSKT